MSDIYQDFILEIYSNPLNSGKIEKPDFHFGASNPLCGDVIEIFLKVEKGKITGVKYTGKGCAISQVSASLLTESLKGKTVEEAKKLTKEDILRLIRIDLSKNPSRMKCALLSLEVLKKALSGGKSDKQL
jgi:nitrogen fixation NifU-like protein